MIPARPMTSGDFLTATADYVSRETYSKLQRYAELLAEWQPRINLVSPKTLPDLWTRHMLDSAQLYPLVRDARRLVDFGSGAGFPGLVLAIMGVPDVHLVESDQRKCVFLNYVSRETKSPVTVHNARIESLPPLHADTVTARALAPLVDLLTYALPHLAPGGRAVFLKGAGWQAETEAAGQQYMFHVKHNPSLTANDGAIVTLTDISLRAQG